MMASIRDLFLAHVGQTSLLPLQLEVERAEGIYIYDTDGKRYLDMNSGISVSSLGHSHPKVVEAIIDQVQSYMHTMVYGEHVQSPQVSFAARLLGVLEESFQSIYYLSSGTEATELSMKIAKKMTGRYEIVASRRAYHGSTQGAESLRSDLEYKSGYMPLIPGIRHIHFNKEEDLKNITHKTACVITEVIQGEAGVIKGEESYLKALRERCSDVGALLVFDEIQSGFGRTGRLFAYQHYGIVPDILMIGKAMGGGMPISGVVSSKHIMDTLVKDPALGHITTFGGHPVSCAAAYASLEVLLESNLIEDVYKKETLIKDRLSQHPIIREVRSAGLMMAVTPIRRKYLKHIVAKAYDLGLLVDWFLFDNSSFRLAPPLVVTISELETACQILLQAMDYAQDQYGSN